MILIDTVYQKVLAIANKEQRGYITPQEFNLFANQAQMEIFEQYFYDMNQFNRVPGNLTEYSDMGHILEEKISAFEKFKVAPSSVSASVITLPSDIYRLGTVFSTVVTSNPIIERVSKKDIQLIVNSPLTKPTDLRPVYVYQAPSAAGVSKIKIFPTATTYTTSNISVNYIKKPSTVNWTYVVINDKAVHNSSAADLQNFELHESEEVELVIKILQLAGISIKDNSLTQLATNKEINTIQQQKA
tara:strand:- start:4326 stop:5057 length:732 start_codon:yes stop_codon:yes gene_type:complete